MQNSNAPPIGHTSQSNPNHLKTDLRGDMLVNVHTSVHAYDGGQILPHIGQVLVSNIPPFPLHSLGGGGSGAQYC